MTEHTQTHNARKPAKKIGKGNAVVYTVIYTVVYTARAHEKKGGRGGPYANTHTTQTHARAHEKRDRGREREKGGDLTHHGKRQNTPTSQANKQ